jgi:hypothetical protein
MAIRKRALRKLSPSCQLRGAFFGSCLARYADCWEVSELVDLGAIPSDEWNKGVLGAAPRLCSGKWQLQNGHGDHLIPRFSSAEIHLSPPSRITCGFAQQRPRGEKTNLVPIPYSPPPHWTELQATRERKARSIVFRRLTNNTPRVLIASDVPGCREVFIHEQTGLLFPVDNTPALATAMQRPADAPDCGRAGRGGATPRRQ